LEKRAAAHLALVRTGTHDAPGDETHPHTAEIAVIVPTLNERDNVPLVAAELARVLGDAAWEVVFVDDDSPDGTIEVVRALAKDDPRIRGLSRIGRRGLAGAVIEGVLSTSAPFIAVMDGDLQHDAGTLPEMLRMLRSREADIVVGSRFVAASGPAHNSSRRNAASAIGNTLARWLLRVELHDPMSGFFAMRRDVFERTEHRLSHHGFKILLDLLASAREPLVVREIQSDFRPRHAGESKLDSLVALDYVGLLVAKATGGHLPIRFVLFSLVGSLGLLVHLTMLRLLLGVDAGFAVAQTAATLVAMVFNYVLNNSLTFRDHQRRGLRFLTGLAMFMAICSVGVVANVGIASLVYEESPRWLLAGVAGAAVGVVWNYVANSVITWRNS
jgi:dolichol-phosphate mannosyltransferase